MSFFRSEGNKCIIVAQLITDKKYYFVFINGNEVYTSDAFKDADIFDSLGQAHAVIAEHITWFQQQTLDYQLLDV
jgi:hypothetical protein